MKIHCYIDLPDLCTTPDTEADVTIHGVLEYEIDEGVLVISCCSETIMLPASKFMMIRVFGDEADEDFEEESEFDEVITDDDYPTLDDCLVSVDVSEIMERTGRED